MSFEDFKKSIENERLLIEAFGPCSPDSTLLEDFSAKICSINCYDYIIICIQRIVYACVE